MSEPENFLARWSRRKQEAERPANEPGVEPREENAPEASAAGGSSADAKPTETNESEFDLSTLPPIDSIDAGTDIRAFLQKGVPLELSRAALRRAWTSDPAIRDFIEVAENQWDFATGSDIPGFGPLLPSDEVRRLVAEVFQGRAEAAPPPENRVQEISEPQNSQEVTQHATLPNPESQNLPEGSSVNDDQVIVHREKENNAAQQDAQHSESALPSQRTHGRALPR